MLQRRLGVLPVLAMLLLLLCFYLTVSGDLGRLAAATQAIVRHEPPPGSHALGSSRTVEVFFTTPTLVYPDRTQQRRTSPLLQALLADIAAARQNIDLASFDFDIPEVTDALLRARARHVVVRVVIDSENLETPEVAYEVGRLQRGGIQAFFDRREPFMHDKIIVIDRRIVWMGSCNLTVNDIYRNNNNMLRIRHRQLAESYAQELEQMFSGRFGVAKSNGITKSIIHMQSTSINAFFSPKDSTADAVIHAIQSARRTIRFMAFSFTSEEIAAAMLERMHSGVSVAGVMERQNAVGLGSQYTPLRAGGAEVLYDGNCYNLHHKIIIIDDRIVITGSYNFTKSAEQDNDENLVIVDDSLLARAFLEEYESVRVQALTPTRCE